MIRLGPWLGGAAIGAIAGAAFVAFKMGAFAPHTEDRPWSLPMFDYQELGGDNIYIKGTLRGAHVGYPYNTWDIRCFHDLAKCEVANVSEIGRDQLGSIDAYYWPIISWTDSVVVLQDDDSKNDTDCARATITINREAKTVEYTSAPLNTDKDYCKKFGSTESQQWVIGQPRQPWEGEAK